MTCIAAILLASPLSHENKKRLWLSTHPYYLIRLILQNSLGVHFVCIVPDSFNEWSAKHPPGNPTASRNDFHFFLLKARFFV
jgi:hypothetical protein